MDAIERRMEGMGSMMGGGMVGLVLLAVAILVLFVWAIGLAALGTLGVWGARKLSGR
jgi:hypothetical protein